MKTIEITLPKLGESVAEATVINWLVQNGDWVEKDQILCEVGTDKVETELPSEFSGKVIQLVAKENEVVPVGGVLLLMEVEDSISTTISVTVADNRTSQVVASQTNSQTKSSGELTKDSELGFISPVVRNMVFENNISLEELKQIKGTGSNGRITKQDINQYLRKQDSVTPKSTSKLSLSIQPNDEVKSLSRMRSLIAEAMQRSVQHIPHVTSFVEINVSALVAKRNSLKEQFAQEGLKLTYTHYMQYAIIQALKSYPQLNSWFNVDEWIFKGSINLGFATALPSGDLIVPNIKNAENLSFKELVKTVNLKAEQATSGQLTPDDLSDTTFTVSNTGIFGSVMGTPIISIPQVAVLALGAIQRKPVLIQLEQEEQIMAADIMMASLSYDHRVIDGALASKFLTEVKHQMESL